MLDLFQGTERRQENKYPKLDRQFKQCNNESMNSWVPKEYLTEMKENLKFSSLPKTWFLGQFGCG